MDVEKNGYIKLPYGFVSKENDKQKLRFNLPLDYKKNVLFRKVLTLQKQITKPLMM